MSEEKILTLHPRGKGGKNIDKKKYDAISGAMLNVLKGKTLTHDELFAAIANKLGSGFEGNISWYSETVKLDLEARGMVERTKDKPQKYFLTG